MIAKLLLDLLIVALLGATVFFAIVLNRRIEGLRRDNAAMAALVAGFQEVAQRAEAGAASLKLLAGEGTAELRSRLDKAFELRSDMDALIVRAEDTADKLMDATSAARGMRVEPGNVAAARTEAEDPHARLRALRRAR